VERLHYARRAEAFHDRIDDRLLDLEQFSGALDLLILSYDRWIHGRLLDRFAGRMINQHPGDLTHLDGMGNRVLVGNDPVLDALKAGLPLVRTSTFFVDAGRDSGAIICQGPVLKAAGVPAKRNCADDLEQTLKRESDWPSLVCAITLIAAGAVAIDRGRPMRDGSPGVSVCGVPLGLGGLRLMEDLSSPDSRMSQIFGDVRESLGSLR